jgi:cob(I)alamin adenosyltransferase
LTEKGLVLVYTGDGKGKTTAAVGLGLRAAGHGLKVKMLQFMKGPGNVYGESLAVARHVPGFEIGQVGRDTFVKKGNPAPEDIQAAQRGLQAARESLGGAYDLVILDELNVAVHFGLLDEVEVLDVLRSRAPHVNVVVTGRYASERMIELADMVSEVREVKHHFRKGARARKGIEY